MFSETIENKKIIIAGLISSKLNTDGIFTALENSIRIKKAEIVGYLIQRRGISRSKGPGGVTKLDLPLDNSTYISKGKAEELKELCNKTEADSIIFINKLNPTQIERLKQITDCQIISLSNFV